MPLATGPDLRVLIVDAAGAAQSIGGGTQYAEGDTAATATGNLMMWKDAANTIVAVSKAKPAPVQLGDGTDYFTTATFADVNATLATAITKVQRIAADMVVQNAGDNQANRVRSAKDLIAGVAGGSIPGVGMAGLDGSTFRPLAITAAGNLLPGTTALALGKAEDTAHSSGDVGIMPLAVRQDAQVILSGADGRYTPLSVNQFGSLRVAAGGHAKKPSITFTRPANTTPYSIGDEVGTSGTAPTAITVARVNAGTGFIIGGRIVYSNYPAVVPDFVVYLFSETVTLAGDNAQLNLSDADLAKCIGILFTQRTQPGVYSAGVPSSTGNFVAGLAPVIPIAFEAPAGVATIFACIVTLSAFTPVANSETAILALDTDRD